MRRVFGQRIRILAILLVFIHCMVSRPRILNCAASLWLLCPVAAGEVDGRGAFLVLGPVHSAGGRGWEVCVVGEQGCLLGVTIIIRILKTARTVI
jgi:hypothetical protein